MITGKTQLLGIIGSPIEHSLSPVIQNAALQSLGLDFVYIPMAVATKDLEKALDGFAATGLKGFNVTIPHKQAIIPLLREITPLAQMVGAVNTVWYDDGWKGTNTDVEGFVAPLKQLSRDWSNIQPIVLGNGGAARAVVAGCHQLGCPTIHVVGRDITKLQEFANSWQQLRVEIHLWEELKDLLSNAQLIVNSTPIGMYPNVQNSPIEAELMGKLATGAIAYDLIYTPSPTRFLCLAAQENAVIIDGLEMLIQQGAAAFKIWVDHQAPVEVMREALKKYICAKTS